MYVCMLCVCVCMCECATCLHVEEYIYIINKMVIALFPPIALCVKDDIIYVWSLMSLTYIYLHTGSFKNIVLICSA